MMTAEEIARRLREVAAEMEQLGAAMDYYGGFNGRMARHLKCERGLPPT